jgi:signal transduction histidine kinase/CheY-like chemotaxis protein
MKMDTTENLLRMPITTPPQRKGKDQHSVGGGQPSRLRDPREMERTEIETYLQSAEHFPTKGSLLEFARRYNVPVNARTQREEIIRLCLRMIYDIPASFAGLRAAERPTPGRTHDAETHKVLENFFTSTKGEDHADGQSIKKIATSMLDSIVHCHEVGLLLTQVRGADAAMFLQALETCESPIETHVRFLSNVVDFARLEAGNYECARTPFRLRDCIGESLKRVAISAHQKNLELCYAVHPEAPERVVGDPARLQQTIINLVDNAIKFTETGEVVVEVTGPGGNSLSSDIHSETYECLFSVRDTGVGIVPEQVQALTKLFSSEDKGEKPPLGGLGLAISHRLVGLMGGQMNIANETHGGVVCSFSARLYSDKCQTKGMFSHVRALHGRKILLIDDNATCRRILQELLLEWGAQPALAANGREALSLLYKQPGDDPFTAIVIDAHLADIEGFASIRRQHLTEEPALVTPMIMTLASLDPTREVERYRELQVAAFLHKPITPAELLQALLEACVAPGTSFPEADVLDRAALWTLVAGDRKLLRELIGLFDRDCPRLFFTLQHAVLLENHHDVIAAAHALKGAVSHFAARGVLRILAVVENFGGQGDFAQVHETMAHLITELSRLKRALDELGTELAENSLR